MYEAFLNYFTDRPALAIIFIGVATTIALLILAKAMQAIGMERIRGYVYKLFVMAEHEFKYGENEKKFEYVICLAKSAVPSPFDLFITESLLRKTVQLWFDICKDLLDDGKFNGTGKEGDIYEDQQ